MRTAITVRSSSTNPPPAGRPPNVSSRSFVPRLTRGEYWILNSLIHYGFPLFYYREPDRFLRSFVPGGRGHGLTESEVIVALLGMFNAGWIEGETILRQERSVQPTRTPFIATGAEIRRAFEPERYYREGDPHRRRRRDPEVAIRLTAEGGAVWEAFTEPRWEEFFDHWHKPEDGPFETQTIRTVCREHATRFLSYWAELEQFDPRKIVWKPVAPFEATYWKTLPVGFEASFRSEAPHRREGMSLKENAALQGLGYAARRDSQHLRRWRAWD
ncbi:hypothetical protein LzC2_42320 [Planctomycetes bacterium LzC2]|uniref:Uncharacterized protein n=1 Tax=Alienimonas chondri TaxID=2681879 RepID=A0ABX1VJ47_9PLAN|nr:hypothetical protein [Alienimonas chondri]